jgi:hypothetical protein
MTKIRKIKTCSPGILLRWYQEHFRYTTDGRWLQVFHDGPGGRPEYEVNPGTPDITALLLASIRQQFRLSWEDAVDAVCMLTRNPVPPPSDASEGLQMAEGCDHLGAGVPGPQEAGKSSP